MRCARQGCGHPEHDHSGGGERPCIGGKLFDDPCECTGFLATRETMVCDCGAQVEPSMGMQHDEACPFVTGKPRPVKKYMGAEARMSFRGQPIIPIDDTTTRPSDAALYLKSVRGCARCGRDHDEVYAEKLERPFAPPDAIDAHGGQMTWTHWFMCPYNGQPVLVMTDVPTPEQA